MTDSTEQPRRRSRRLQSKADKNETEEPKKEAPKPKRRRKTQAAAAAEPGVPESAAPEAETIAPASEQTLEAEKKLVPDEPLTQTDPLFSRTEEHSAREEASASQPTDSLEGTSPRIKAEPTARTKVESPPRTEPVSVRADEPLSRGATLPSAKGKLSSPVVAASPQLEGSPRQSPPPSTPIESEQKERQEQQREEADALGETGEKERLDDEKRDESMSAVAKENEGTYVVYIALSWLEFASFSYLHTVPPPKHEPTSTLHITNFVRPLTLPMVQEMLEKFGTIEYFWMNKIKSHCYVKFLSEDSAVATRQAMWHAIFPPETGRPLELEFLTYDRAQEMIAEEQAKEQAAVQRKNSMRSDRNSNGNNTNNNATPVAQPPRKRNVTVLSLDALFQKTAAIPPLYYKPVSQEEAEAKLRSMSSKRQRRT